MPTWIKRIFNMIIEYTSDISNLITNKADLVDGKVPAEQLPSYVDDVIEFNNLQAPDTQISIIVGNNSYKNQIRFINGSSTSSNRIGSEDKYPNMFVNFGENTSEDDWTTFEPEKGKIYVNTTNNHSYRWSGSYLIDLDFNWSQGIKDLQENTVSIKSQTLTEAQQAQVWQNLGLDLVVLKFPKGVTSITLTDEEDVKLQLGAAVLVTADSTDTTGNIYNANNHIFTTIDSKNTSQPLYYSLALFSGLLYCSYDKVSKKFTYQGIIRLIDTGAVRFDRTTTLTASYKDTALSNIGLQWIHVPYSLLGTMLDDETYTKLTNAYGIILTDIPSEYYGPWEFICGANNSDGTKVFAGLNLANTSAYIALRTNHNLTTVRYARTYDGAVPYDASKTLTSAQQDVALSNIGLDFVHVDYSILGTTVTDEMFAVLDNAKGIILVNLPSNYYNPFVFIKGNNTSTSCIFVGFSTGTTYCQIKLDKSKKILSNINANLTYVDAVRYIEKQSLTNTQKDTVLSNIGLGFILLDYSLLGTTLDDSTAALVENANGLILFNAPNNERPVILPRCSFTNNVVYFNSWRGVSLVDQITYNVGTKALSAIWSTEVPINSVKYNGVQNLTDTQKQQARSNIGATSCYDEYKLAGGTKYTTEADFNAQLVKVMDMTVVE